MPRNVGHRRRVSPPSGSIAVAMGGWCVVALALVGWEAVRAQAPDGGLPEAFLLLPGGSLSGRLLDDAPDAGGTPPTIRWQSPAFAGPFAFPLEHVAGITLGSTNAPSTMTGPWQVELVGGDVVVGRLESIDDTRVAMSIGPEAAAVAIAVRREHVERLAAVKASSTRVWNGGLERLQTSADGHWRSQGGGIANTTPGAMVRFDAADADQLRYDVTLAWSEPPRVRLGFGEFRTTMDDNGATIDVDQRYRIELSPEGMCVVRDEATPDGKGLAELEPCGPLPDRGLTMSVFVDRKAGRFVVFRSGETRPLADLTVEPIGDEFTVTRNAPHLPRIGYRDRSVVGQGLRIDVTAGTLVVERLRTIPWSGSLPGPEDDHVPSVVRIDGESIAGTVTRLSDDGRAFVVEPAGATGAAPLTLPLDDVTLVRCGAPAEIGRATPRHVRVSDREGSTLTGELVGVSAGKVTILHPAIDGPVSLPIGLLSGMASVVTKTEEPPLPGLIGRMELEHGAHDGCLVAIPADDAGDRRGAIGWLPRGSLIASGFSQDADGRGAPATIRYGIGGPVAAAGADDENGWVGATIIDIDGKAMIQEAIPGGPLSRVGLVTPAHLRAVAPRGDGVFVPTVGLPIDDVMFLVQGRAGTQVQLRVAQGQFGIRGEIPIVRELHPAWGRNRQRLHEVLAAQERLLARATDREGANAADGDRSEVILDTGEAVAGRIASIDGEGVRLLREGADPVTIPNDAVKAVELVPMPAASISPEKFRSLTTLPRAQRHLPPTHLVRSLSGDYLRGRLVGMDGESLRIAVEADPRGKPLTLPREDVARVIWLHPEFLDDTWQPPALVLPAGLPVEAVTVSAERRRIMATGIEGNVLVGAHPILGASRIDLEGIDRLLLGGVLEETPRRPPYAQWQLQPAAEPRNFPPKRPPKP